MNNFSLKGYFAIFSIIPLYLVNTIDTWIQISCLIFLLLHILLKFHAYVLSILYQLGDYHLFRFLKF